MALRGDWHNGTPQKNHHPTEHNELVNELTALENKIGQLEDALEGGTTGRVATKTSNSNYAIAWEPFTGITKPGSGDAGKYWSPGGWAYMQGDKGDPGPPGKKGALGKQGPEGSYQNTRLMQFKDTAGTPVDGRVFGFHDGFWGPRDKGWF